MKLSKRNFENKSIDVFYVLGAGNLMFPTMLGKEVGTNIVYAMIYFLDYCDSFSNIGSDGSK